MTNALLNGPPVRAIVLDTETTGFSPTNEPPDRLVELAACEIINGRPTGQTFHRYLNPERPVPEGARAVHGLGNDFLDSQPRFADIAPAFLEFLGDHRTPIIAHNASFDERFIHAELEWANARPAGRLDFQCSLAMARTLKTPTANHKLETLAAHIDHRWDEGGAHSALADTRALIAVLNDLLWPLAAKHWPKRPNPFTQRQSPGTNPAASGPGKPPPTPPPELPADFVPLTAEADARIVFRDTASLERHITRRGQPWSEQEDRDLVRRFVHQSQDIEALVEAHGRTPRALFMRLERLGVIAPGHPYSAAEAQAKPPADDPLGSPSKAPTWGRAAGPSF